MFTGIIHTAENYCLIGAFVQRMQPIMIYLVLPITEQGTDTAMVEGNLSPDFMLRARKGIFIDVTQNGEKGSKIILKLTCENIFF